MDTQYSTQSQEIKTFIMNTDVFSVDDEDNITNDKGEIVTEMIEVCRELDQYKSNYQDRLAELESDDELSNNAMYDVLIHEFPGLISESVWEDCADKEYSGSGGFGGLNFPIHSI